MAPLSENRTRESGVGHHGVEDAAAEARLAQMGYNYGCSQARASTELVYDINSWPQLRYHGCPVRDQYNLSPGSNRWRPGYNLIRASVVIIIVTLLVMADDRRSGKFVFSHYDASAAGWPSGWAFFVGLLQAAYTLTGYGMVAAMCEEVQNPEREVPKAMVLSVAAAAVTGIIYLVPILFVLPDIPTLLGVASGQPMPLLYMIVTGSPGGGFGLLFLIIGIGFFAGIGALTAASFNAFTGVATICLSVSYGLPILVSLLRGRKLVRTASYSLGKFGFIINVLTVAWIALAIVLFTMPTAIPVTPQSMNYASVVFAGFTAISAIWYAVWGRKHYRGPHVSAADFLGDAVPVSTAGHPGTKEVVKDEEASAGNGKKVAEY
ncbi:hypothetical protein FRC07_009113 [Ceratobasidium sp. 392]|nr:hypothetical protein FRC07_009113 [Ceratobasidium sp. 392]